MKIAGTFDAQASWYAEQDPTTLRWRVIVQRQMNGTRYLVLVPASDAHGLFMAEHGQHDPSWTVALKHIKKGHVVIDVGAHIGLFSLLACAKGADVVAIEPAAHNLECLKQLATINSGLKLKVLAAAASDRAGTLRFDQNGPHGHVVESGGVEVAALRLDSLDLTDVALVKIDVEGHELAVLDGMGTQRVPMILCESNAHALDSVGASTDALRAKLESMGYTNFRWHNGELVPAPVGEIQPACVVDLVAVANELAPSFSARPKLTRTEILQWAAACRLDIAKQHLGEAHLAHLERELARL